MRKVWCYMLGWVMCCLQPCSMLAQPVNSPFTDSLNKALTNEQDPSAQLDQLILLCEDYIYRDHYAAALPLIRRMHLLAQSQKDTTSLAISINMEALIARQQGDFSTAMKQYLEALALTEATKDSAGIAALCTNIGEIFHEQDEHAKAASYFRRAGLIYAARKDSMEIGANIMNLANGLDPELYSDSIMKLEQQALLYMDRYNPESRELKAIIYMNMANTQSQLGKYDAALASLRQAYQFACCDLQVLTADVLQEIGLTYLVMEQWDSAIHYLSRAYPVYEQLKTYDNLRNVTAALYEVYDSIGNKGKALDFLLLHQEYSDSFDIIQSRNDVALLEARYELEKAEKESALKQQSLDELEHEATLSSLILKGAQVWTHASTPIQQPLPAGFKAKAIDGGSNHLLILFDDGHVGAIGNNTLGECGAGLGNPYLFDVRLAVDEWGSAMHNVKEIAAGNGDSKLITANGHLHACGYGELATVEPQKPWFTEVTIDGTVRLDFIRSVTSGNVGNFAVGSDGSLWSWGWNGFGQLGQGMNHPGGMDLIFPERVQGIENVITVACGGHLAYHALAKKADGTVCATGDGTYGALGIGPVNGVNPDPNVHWNLQIEEFDCHINFDPGQMLKQQPVPTTDKKELGKLSFAVYPNPAQDQFFVEGWMDEEQPVQLQLLDVTGKQIMQQKVWAKQPVQIEHLPAGIYLVTLNQGDQSQTIKFVKQ